MKKDKKLLGSLDQLKRRFGIDSEVTLASTLGISPAMLAHVRAGRRPLPFPARIRMLDKLGYEFTRDNLLRILPDEARAILIEIDNRRLNERLRKKNGPVHD